MFKTTHLKNVYSKKKKECLFKIFHTDIRGSNVSAYNKH